MVAVLTNAAKDALATAATRARATMIQNGEQVIPDDLTQLMADYEELRDAVVAVQGDAGFTGLAGGVQTQVNDALS